VITPGDSRAASIRKCSSSYVQTAVKRLAADYALLTHLLDEALDLDEAGRAKWLAMLPATLESQRPALRRMLTSDRAAANRTLKRLERHLGSATRAARRLCAES
jgi:phosphohistidine phosphatase SixA